MAIIAYSWCQPQILFLESRRRFLEVSALGEASFLLQIIVMCYSCLRSSCRVGGAVARQGWGRGAGVAASSWVHTVR